jgi:undecaprenyl-diphosphatase
MKRNNRNFIISLILIFVAITFVFLVKKVDVQPVGVKNTNIGFATLNQFIFNLTGVNILWYHITDWLGLIPIFMTFIYAGFGLIQLIKRKGLLKVDKEILLLGVFYVILVLLYIFFEKVIINYRPILMNGFLEASFPSSHTLMAVCICGSSVMVNKRLFKNKLSKVSNI